MSGAATSVPAITLSDQANTFTTIRGLGGDAGGGLWALSANSADGAGKNDPGTLIASGICSNESCCNCKVIAEGADPVNSLG